MLRMLKERLQKDVRGQGLHLTPILGTETAYNSKKGKTVTKKQPTPGKGENPVSRVTT